MGAGAAVVGAGLSYMGQRQADKDQANAERINAAYYDQEKAFDERATTRSLTVYGRQSDIQFGDQVSAFAKGGADISGSPLSVLAEQKVAIAQEKGAITQEGEMRAELAGLRANQAYSYAGKLESPNRALLEMGTTAMGVGSTFARSSR